LNTQRTTIVLGVFIVVWISGNAIYAKWIDTNRLPSYKPTSAVDADTMNSLKPTEPIRKPALPTLYSADSTNSNYNIPANLWGWYCYPGQYKLDERFVGMVGPTVTLFFGPLECIELRVKKWRPDLEYDMDDIQVKAGTQFLIRESIEESDGILTLTFCAKKPGTINKQWNLITLGFAPIDQLSPKYIAPIRLLSVKALQKK